eukprot:ANDGO_00378.mRNA.1 hypothetical protein
MKHGRRKVSKRVLQYYSTHFRFHRPHRVLCDGPFLHAVTTAKLDLAVCLRNLMLGTDFSDVRAFTTIEVVQELARLGPTYADTLQLARSLPKMSDSTVPAEAQSTLAGFAERISPIPKAKLEKNEVLSLLCNLSALNSELVQRGQDAIVARHHDNGSDRDQHKDEDTAPVDNRKAIDGTESIVRIVSRGNPCLVRAALLCVSTVMAKHRPIPVMLSEIETRWTRALTRAFEIVGKIDPAVFSPNIDRFYVASQVPSVQALAHAIPGVPVIFTERGVVMMEQQPGYGSKLLVEVIEKQKLGVVEGIRPVALPNFGNPNAPAEVPETALEVVHRKKKIKGPNPLSCKKKTLDTEKKKEKKPEKPEAGSCQAQGASGAVHLDDDDAGDKNDQISKAATTDATTAVSGVVNAAESTDTSRNKRKRRRKHASRRKSGNTASNNGGNDDSNDDNDNDDDRDSSPPAKKQRSSGAKHDNNE